MPPRPFWRLMVLIIRAALTAASAFYVLTAPDPAPSRTPCPPQRPVRVEDGPCVPERYLEKTAATGRGRAMIRALFAGLLFALPTCVYLLLTWPG